MKAISIRQPWASMTAAGLRDVDVSNRDTNYRGMVLLHASSRRVGRDCGADMPMELLCRLRNAQTLGLVPYDEEVPLSAVVGFASLTDCSRGPVDSIWSNVGVNWVLCDAQLFDTPIYGIKGKQGLFEVAEISDISAYPHHQVPTPESQYKDGVFSLTMSEMEIERQQPGFPIVLLLCDDGLATPLLASDGQLREVHELHLISSSEVHIFQVSSMSLHEELMAGHLVKYVSIEVDIACSLS